MVGLYEIDVLAWSERQATLLRRHVADAPAGADAPDWANIIGEVVSVGRAIMHDVESLLWDAPAGLLMIEAYPIRPEVEQWRAEVRSCCRQAARRITPAMRARVDLAALYADAVTALPDKIDGIEPFPMPAYPPVTLDDLLSGDPAMPVRSPRRRRDGPRPETRLIGL